MKFLGSPSFSVVDKIITKYMGRNNFLLRKRDCKFLTDICQYIIQLSFQEFKSFISRIKAKTTRTVIETHEVNSGSYVFYDALVNLGTPNQNQTKKPVRVVGYKVAGVKYYVATDRHDLTAEQIATVYKLRWTIENFFKWWKEHLKVYHLIARSEYGLMVQILSGLITYLLLAIYCRNEFNEKVSIKRVRQLRIAILNDLIGHDQDTSPDWNRDNIVKDQKISITEQAKT